ncbi:hypothetical protein MTO96_009261 [Rhipicephalus appendiculatus]
MTGVEETSTSQTDASNAASGSRSTSDSLSRSTAFKEERQNVYNETSKRRFHESLLPPAQKEGNDAQLSTERVGVVTRNGLVSRTAESCSEPSSPPYVRPLITASMPTVPASSPSEQWLLHYKRLKKAKFKCTLLLGHHDTVRSVAVDQNLVVSASDDTTLRVWSVQAGRELCSLRGHTASVNAVLLLSSEQTESLCYRMGRPPTYRLAVSGSSDACLNMWLALEGKLLKSMYTYNAITALCSNHRRLPHCCRHRLKGGKLEVWDVAKGSPLSSVIGHDGIIVSIQVDWTDTVFSASSDGSLKVWQWLSKELCAVQVHDAVATESCQMHCVAVDGSKIFVGRDSANIKVIDWATGRVDYLKNHPHDHGFCKSRFVTGGTALAVWDWAPHENNGEFPVLFLEALAERPQEDDNESNKSSLSPERQLMLYQENAQAADASWCNIM